MEVTFNANQTPVEVLPPATPTAVPLTAPTTTIIPNPVTAIQQVGPQAAVSSPLLLGDTLPDFKDLIIPRLNIVQNIGELKASFQPGMLLFDQRVVLYSPAQFAAGQLKAPPSTPAVLTVLGFRPTRYCEKVAGGARGLIVDSEEKVTANGGTMDYAEWNLKKAAGMKLFECFADALVAIQRPEGVEDDGSVFTYEINGKKYTLGLWGMRGTAYTAAAKRVFFTARRMGCLREGYPTFSYNVSIKENSYPNGNKAWVPVCVPNSRSTPEFLDFVKMVLTS